MFSSQTSEIPQSEPGFFRRFLPELLAAAVTMLVFAPSLAYGFLTDWDDSYYVVHNPHIAFTLENIRYYLHGNTLGLWTPLTMYSLMLDHLIWGGTESAFGFHLTNLLLHGCSAALFTGILRALGLRKGLALACALFWALSPQRLESVVWIAERKDVLSGFLALLSFRLFLVNPEKLRWLLPSILCFLLSLTAKPTAVGLPAAAAVWLCWKYPERFRWKTVLAGAAGVAAVMAALVLFLRFRPEFEAFPRCITVVLHNLLFYSVNGVLPLETNPCYPYIDWSDWWMIPGFFAFAGGLAALSRTAGIAWKTIGLSFLGFGIVFGVFFMPFTGAVVYAPVDYADRYSYLPNLAVWACIGFLLERIFREHPNWIPRFGWAGAALGVFVLGSTLWHMPFWKDSATLGRWGVYSFELPNDRFLVLHAQLGLWNSDPVPIREALEKLHRKNSRPDLPRETEYTRETRRGTIQAFEMAAALLEGKRQEAYAIFDAFIPKAETTPLYNFELYDARLKELLFRSFLETNDRARLAAFEKWGSTVIVDGKDVPNYPVTAILKYLKQDYAGAIRDWQYMIDHDSAFPGIQDYIRNAEMQLQKNRKK